MGDKAAIEWTGLWWLLLMEAAYRVMVPEAHPPDDSASRRRWAETPAEGWGNLCSLAWREADSATL